VLVLLESVFNFMNTGMLEIAQRFNVTVAINVKGMSFKIKYFLKIIAISEDIRWLPKYR
jgi:hypothetical protein